MTVRERIVHDPAICAGQPIIQGTRVLARSILGYLAHGETVETILQEFPSVTEDDVRAVIAFAAASAAEDLPAPAPLPPTPRSREAEAGRERAPVSSAEASRPRV